jgi:hypothetical protein
VTQDVNVREPWCDGMKTYDFTDSVSPSSRPGPAPAQRPPSQHETEDGWRAYERWLRRLREQLDEEHAAVPRGRMP